MRGSTSGVVVTGSEFGNEAVVLWHHGGHVTERKGMVLGKGDGRGRWPGVGRGSHGRVWGEQGSRIAEDVCGLLPFLPLGAAVLEPDL